MVAKSRNSSSMTKYLGTSKPRLTSGVFPTRRLLWLDYCGWALSVTEFPHHIPHALQYLP